MQRTSLLNWKWLIIILAIIALASIFPQALQAQSPVTHNIDRTLLATTTTTYTLVDTNQTKCYNASTQEACPATGAAFSGQDAQFSGHAPSYTNNNDGTITDNVTGLMWQRSPDLDNNGTISATDKLTYTAALTYCNNLTLAGYIDWRLPNIKTLYSLIEFNGTDPSGFNGTDTSGLTPFIDKNYFAFAYGDTSAGERIIDAQYASSTPYVSTTGSNNVPTLFGVNFADGRIKGYGLIAPGGGNKTFFIKCVRGNTSYGVNALVDNGDQTITDNATGLMWMKSDSGTALTWQDALTYAQTQNAANYLGHNDWRLPDAKEMQSILDYTRSPSTTNSAAIDPIFNATSFINEGGQTDWPWYWTSTTHATYNGMGGSAVYIAFGRASGWQKATPSATCYTFYDVHGAGAQRSDPKTSSGRSVIGTACNGGTAYGLGPQGDVQRGLNHLRLVRDVTNVTPLSAAFTYAPSSPLLDQTVWFTNTSIGSPTSWQWNFGDGITSTLQHPTHTFTTTGSFTVTLLVENANGSNTTSHVVWVFGYALYLPLITSNSGMRPLSNLNSELAPARFLSDVVRSSADLPVTCLGHQHREFLITVLQSIPNDLASLTMRFGA
jgi:PKD repeat protein